MPSRTLSYLTCLLTLTAIGSAQNAQITVTNAAGGPVVVPLNSLAPGSIMSIQVLRGGPVTINPDPSKITVTLTPQNGAPVNARVLSAFVGTIQALLPADLPPGPAQVTLVNDTQSYPPAQVSIVPVAVGVFAKDSSGLGSALAQNDSPTGEVTLNQLTNPAHPADYVTLWATGLGQSAQGTVSVEVGGVPVMPVYAGPSPTYPGLDQINIPLPAAAPDGCYVSVQVKAGNSVSNLVSIAKTPGTGACAHPFDLTAAELQALDSGQSVHLNTANLRSSVEPPSTTGLPQNTYTRNEFAIVQLLAQRAWDIALLAQPEQIDTSYFTCSLTNPLTIPRLIANSSADAGPSLTLQGPAQSLSLTSNNTPMYTANITPPAAVADPAQLPAAFFAQGSWQLTGPGGKDFGPFQTTLTLPPAIRWTNRAALASIDRTVDQTVTWQPDGYSPTDVMTVTLSTGYFTQSLPSGAIAAGVSCRAPATAGKLTIPSALMRQMPASPTLSTSPGGTLSLQIAPRPDRRTRFEIPLVPGGSARSLIDYTLNETLRTDIR